MIRTNVDCHENTGGVCKSRRTALGQNHRGQNHDFANHDFAPHAFSCLVVRWLRQGILWAITIGLVAVTLTDAAQPKKNPFAPTSTEMMRDGFGPPPLPMPPPPNLVTNCDFSAKDPLAGWRVDYPTESFYKANKNYISISNQGGRKCALIDLPPGIGGNQGGKIESPFTPCEPGAKYIVSADCMTWNSAAKLFVEVYTVNPMPERKFKTDISTVPAADGRPPLLRCHRVQIKDPPADGKTWTTVWREFVLPKSVTILGKEQPPLCMTVKVTIYKGTPNAIKGYFTNFRLYKIKGP